MSDSRADEAAPFGASDTSGGFLWGARREPFGPLPLAAQYAASLSFVAVATILAFAVRRLIGAPNLPLLFVLPVVIAATIFGWGPSLAAVVAGVLAFDFFFTEPYYSLAIANPADLWAAGLLLVIAAVVSAVAAESRRRGLEARQAAEQARALQALAHVVIESRPQPVILQAAATALNQIFRAPSVVFLQRAGAFLPVATAGGGEITGAEEEAANGSLESQIAARAETYPYDRSKFDFWPVAMPKGGGCVIGVDFTRSGRERPDTPERFIEIVGAYLAAACGRPGAVPSTSSD